MLAFACLVPHPPLLMPHIGSDQDRRQVSQTINNLQSLNRDLIRLNPDRIIITSPHPDWGFSVPLHFLATGLKQTQINSYLTDLKSLQEHYQRGIEIYQKNQDIAKLAWIASGDMSHRLNDDGPYGFHPDGPKFDQKFIELLGEKDLQGILNLDPQLTDNAGECGLRSFCMALGAASQNGADWQPKVLSYEKPFGVGYLVAQLV